MGANDLILTTITAIATASLAIITYNYAKDTHRMVELSSDAQEIEYIQRRLEKLYYPLKITLNSYEMSKENLKSETYVSKIKNDMHEIMPYLYLSSGQLNSSLTEFISIFDKNWMAVIKKYNYELEKLKEQATYSETETYKMFQLYLNNSPVDLWIKLEETEVEKAKGLYSMTLDRVNVDILFYQHRLNELTNDQSVPF
ncbi:hypothetical protein [Methanosarcina sp.]|uniref:hypothetical protein n=1 Tax=Methanosarcina sp. TaxID=2213 RepID=UPI002ABC9573|nr:hypothetical protein [Methanosarcina sp.]MDY9924895.1 hypothetical protein [Methanosarcina sp.]